MDSTSSDLGYGPAIAAVGRRILLALAPFLLVLELPGAIEHWHRPDDGLVARDRTIMVVTPEGPAASIGLLPGDRILEVEQRSISNYGSYAAAIHGRTSGESLEFLIARGGISSRVQLTLGPPSIGQRARDFLLSTVAVSLLFLGFISYYRRPDPLGRWFHVSCLLLAYNFLDLPTFASASAMHLLEGVRASLQLFLAAAFLRFFLMFPEGVRSNDRLYRRRRWVLAAPLLLSPLHIGLYVLAPISIESTLALTLQAVSALLVAAYFGFALFIFARKSMQRDRWERWNKLRVAALGSTAGLAPLLLTSLLRQFWPTSIGAVDNLAVLFLPLAPASFSLALLRAGAIDLSYLVRQSLLGAALTIPVLAAMMLIGLGAIDGASVDLGPGTLLAEAAVLIVAILLVPLRSRVAGIIDHLFYPEQRRLRHAAADIAERIQGERDPDRLACLLVTGLADLVGAEKGALYIVQQDGARRVQCLESDDAHSAPELLAPDAVLSRLAFDAGELLILPPLLSGSRPPQLDEKSRSLIAATDAVILCPLVVGKTPIALLALGPAKGGRQYRSQELYHVQQLARQASLAFENALLHREDLEHDRMRTELKLAREIQSKLLPEEDLTIGDFHCCGRMESSMQVGGDLFDHFAMADGRIVLAVADAAGKGVPASLLMSSMRSSIRETMRPGIDIAEAMSHLNREVHGMTGVAHFIAMYLAILNPRSNVLEYAVAGIEPPLWYRAAEARVELLSRGGALLGVDPTAAYRSGILKLQPGDVVFAYSDGMIDEEDAEGEEFGLPRLKLGARQAARAEAPTIVARLMASLDAHGSGEATDDRTLLVLKRSPAEALGMKSAAS